MVGCQVFLWGSIGLPHGRAFLWPAVNTVASGAGNPGQGTGEFQAVAPIGYDELSLCAGIDDNPVTQAQRPYVLVVSLPANPSRSQHRNQRRRYDDSLQ